jgi:DNA-binding XRE family transcriptional regulator
MRTVQLTIDGTEYVAVPKADYLRLVGGDAEFSEAETFTRGALGRSLRAAREHAGITQADLAKKVRKAQGTVSAAENGTIRVGESYVKSVLKACGLPEDWTAPAKKSR